MVKIKSKKGEFQQSLMIWLNEKEFNEFIISKKVSKFVDVLTRNHLPKL